MPRGVFSSAALRFSAAPFMGSRQDFPNHFAIDIRETEIASGVAVGEFFVIESKLVENRRVQIVEMHAAIHDAEAIFIGRAEGQPAPDAAAGHPGAETFRLMLAAMFLQGL